MGRKKIEIKFIENKKERAVSLNYHLPYQTSLLILLSKAPGSKLRPLGAIFTLFFLFRIFNIIPKSESELRIGFILQKKDRVTQKGE